MMPLQVGSGCYDYGEWTLASSREAVIIHLNELPFPRVQSRAILRRQHVIALSSESMNVDGEQKLLAFSSGGHLQMTHNVQVGVPTNDDIVRAIYAAGAGLGSWLKPMQGIIDLYGGATVHLLGVNKGTGVMTMSYETGDCSAECALDYLRTYNKIDPRLALQRNWPIGKWMACEEHFDEAFVANDPFYQEFLIPYGGRYLYGTNLYEDDTQLVVIGHITRYGDPPLTIEKRAAFRALSEHVCEALRIQRHLNRVVERNELGFALLDRMRQPVIVLDAHRRITYCGEAAKDILLRGDVIYESDGLLVCRNGESDLDLAMGLRELALVPLNTMAAGSTPVDRRSLRLRRRNSQQIVAGTLLALRPTSVMGAFGAAPQALLTLFQPGASTDIDPFLLSATFDLTPAEARVAAKLVSGMSVTEIAKTFRVSVATIRTQLSSVYDKTGTNRQSDLVRLLLAASAF